MSKTRVHAMFRTISFAAIMLNTLWVSSAICAEISEWEKEVAALEKLASDLKVTPEEDSLTKLQRAESRLVDAQILYAIGDYEHAAIILYDYIARYSDTLGYPEALYYLADSLFLRRDYVSARVYAQKIASDARNPYYQEALLRLIEIDLALGDTSEVKKYLKALDDIPAGQMIPQVPYVKGKYFYFTGQSQRAIDSFSQIAVDKPYYLQAQYFIGTTHVRDRHVDQANDTFRRLLIHFEKTFENIPTVSESDAMINDLSYMALGRLAHQGGQVLTALEYYGHISAQSSQLEQALFEMAWAYVKMEKYEDALRQLDRLTLSFPKSPLLPEVSVLQANLLIRLEQYGAARHAFGMTRDHYIPIRDRLNELLAAHENPQVFFAPLLPKEHRAFATGPRLPENGIQWLREKKEIRRAIRLVDDIHELERGVDESREILQRLTVLLSSAGKANIYPEFAKARMSALGLENRAARVLVQLVDEEERAIRDSLNSKEKDNITHVRTRRKTATEIVLQSPPTLEAYQERQRNQQYQIVALRQQLSAQEIYLRHLQDELAATEAHFLATPMYHVAAARSAFDVDSKQIQMQLTGSNDEIRTVSRDVNVVRDTLGPGGFEESTESQARKTVIEAVWEEHSIIQGADVASTGSASMTLHANDALMQRVRQVQSRLTEFNALFSQQLEQKVASVRAAMAEEEANMANVEAEIKKQRSNVDIAAGTIVRAGLTHIVERFDEIVMRSEIGLIDVSWALKDAKSRHISSLVRERKLELNMLDENFAQVLDKE